MIFNETRKIAGILLTESKKTFYVDTHSGF